MARIQDVTGECFKQVYDFIIDRIGENDPIFSDINSAIYRAERNVMLELIKREAVEQVLSDRVMRYAEYAGGQDELTGAI